MKWYRLIGCVCLLQASVCNAEVYKWTDEDGTVQFSDSPPNNSNVEKVNVNSTEEPSNISSTVKDNESDTEIISYMEELADKIEEINKEAESCYYNAINRKVLDVSCKNYKTLIDRDFKPLTQKIKESLRDSTISKKTREEASKKLDAMKDTAESADENYNKAIKYLYDLSK